MYFRLLIEINQNKQQLNILVAGIGVVVGDVGVVGVDCVTGLVGMVCIVGVDGVDGLVNGVTVVVGVDEVAGFVDVDVVVGIDGVVEEVVDMLNNPVVDDDEAAVKKILFQSFCL